MDLRAAYSSKRMPALRSLCVETTGEGALKLMFQRLFISFSHRKTEVPCL